ncbi:MAG: GMP synthase [Bacteroidetes bacterium]|nr:MAG: GMP synthase [Bacteroidota bacterium]
MNVLPVKTQLAQLAILDMYNATPNQGMRAIQELLQPWKGQIHWQVFDVRAKEELPSVEDFDLFISTGGPGDPLEGNGRWDRAYYELLDEIWLHNLQLAHKKYVFFICHSFQMACDHFGLANVTPRNQPSFGIFPVHKTPDGLKERLLEPLPNPFYAADFRNFQVIQPQLEVFEEQGATIVAMERLRDNPSMERAIMAVRFSDAMFGTQFHPEADPEGMLIHFSQPERKAHIMENYGEAIYNDMIAHLKDPDKISLTHQTIIPRFLAYSMQKIVQEK